MIRWALAGLLITGCAGPLGLVEEREAAEYLLWSKRGALLGEMAKVYCRSASPQERRWMKEASINHAGEAKVAILCPFHP